MSVPLVIHVLQEDIDRAILAWRSWRVQEMLEVIRCPRLLRPGNNSRSRIARTCPIFQAFKRQGMDVTVAYDVATYGLKKFLLPVRAQEVTGLHQSSWASLQPFSFEVVKEEIA